MMKEMHIREFSPLNQLSTPAFCVCFCFVFALRKIRLKKLATSSTKPSLTHLQSSSLAPTVHYHCAMLDCLASLDFQSLMIKALFIPWSAPV